MRSARRRWPGLGSLAALGLLAAGCAGPNGSGEASARDAASPCAEVSAPARLGAALREDPPLPGTEAVGWPSLETSSGEPGVTPAHEHGTASGDGHAHLH